MRVRSDELVLRIVKAWVVEESCFYQSKPSPNSKILSCQPVNSSHQKPQYPQSIQTKHSPNSHNLSHIKYQQLQKQCTQFLNPSTDPILFCTIKANSLLTKSLTYQLPAATYTMRPNPPSIHRSNFILPTKQTLS